MGLMIGRFGRFFERLDIWSSNSSICFEENFKLLNLSHRILSKGLTQSKIKFFSRVLIRISLPENRIILQCSTLQKFLEEITSCMNPISSTEYMDVFQGYRILQNSVVPLIRASKCLN